jgi:pimeloyl-ACP methyl ester carboxylesterase
MTRLLNATTGKVAAQGAELYYEIAGAGAPMLLIHGGLGDSRMWDDQYAAFAQHFRVVRFDLRSFGQSSAPPDEFSYGEDVRALIESLELAPAHLVALSFGAMVAIDLALTYPALVESLVLVSPAIGGAAMSAAVQEQIQAADDAAERGDLDRALEIENEIWIYGPRRRADQVDPDVRRRMTDMNRLAWQRSEEGGEPRWLAPRAVARLSELTMPVLVIVGEEDIPDMAERAELIKRELPGARVETIPNAAHQLNMENPELFNRLVIDFCRG